MEDKDSMPKIERAEADDKLSSDLAQLAKEIRIGLERTFNTHSKLIVGMEEWSINDYFYQKAGSSKLKQGLVSLIAPPENVLVRGRVFNRKIALRRVDTFLKDVQRIVDLCALYTGGKNEDVKSLQKYLEEYRKLVPAKPQKMTSYQVASIVSAVIAAILLTQRVAEGFDPIGWTLMSVASLAMFFGFWVGAAYTGISLAYMLREQIWYRILLKRFDVGKQEYLALKAVRKLTKRITEDLYK